MTNHLEVPFEDKGTLSNATVQLDKNGSYITISNRTIYIERRYVEEFVHKWSELQQENF